MSPGCKLRRKRLVTRPEPIAGGCFVFLRKSVSRASARRRRCWAIVCELFNVVVAVLSRRRLGGAAGATAATWREGAHLAGGLGGFAGGDAGGGDRGGGPRLLRGH